MAQSFEVLGSMTIKVADWLPAGVQMAMVGPVQAERGGVSDVTRLQVSALYSGQLLRGLFEIGPVQFNDRVAFCPVRLVQHG